MNKLPHRNHPFRLNSEVYATWQTPIFLTMCFKPRGALEANLARLFEELLEDQAKRWGLAVHAYCLMPNHMHVVCSVLDTQAEFETFIRRFKREFSRRAHRSGFSGFTWQRSFWDRHAREEEDVRVRIEYTLDNPVRKGLCERREQWPWLKHYGWPSP